MKLDDELIELGADEESDLEAEVEQEDETRQKIGRAILTIEDVLVADNRDEGKDMYWTDSRSGAAADSTSSVSHGRDDHPATLHTLSTDPYSHQVIVTSISASLVPVTSVTANGPPVAIVQPPLTFL